MVLTDCKLRLLNSLKLAQNFLKLRLYKPPRVWYPTVQEELRYYVVVGSHYRGKRDIQFLFLLLAGT
jgi:hypothetical protein